jgi:mono/diheme cytochrome c family protein
VHGTVSTIDPEATAPSGAPMALPLVVGASDIAVSPDGTQVAVVSTGNSWPVAGELLPNVLVMPLDQVGGYGSCSAGGQRADGEAVAVAFDEDARVIVQSREPAQLVILGGSTISLSDESVADTGTALFHMNSGFGVACASCHPEGRDDGRVWQFAGIGPRRTQTFAGGLIDTAPFHWSGDVSDLPALVHEVFVSRMGGPQPNRQQIEHFSEFLDRIPAPIAPALDHDAVVRGKQLFDDPSVACASCHQGEHLTNNESVDVGTGGVFQVPSLVGVSARAPFLHDGCAETLEDRFGACGGDAHGATADLGDAEMADLLTYLKSL